MLSPKEVISKLKVCTYKYNDKMPLGDKIQFGFLAQDILDAFGDEYNFVAKDPNGEFYKVNYFQLIAPLVSVVQDQQKEIDKLKEELNLLKQKV